MRPAWSLQQSSGDGSPASPQSASGSARPVLAHLPQPNGSSLALASGLPAPKARPTWLQATPSTGERRPKWAGLTPKLDIAPPPNRAHCLLGIAPHPPRPLIQHVPEHPAPSAAQYEGKPGPVQHSPVFRSDASTSSSSPSTGFGPFTGGHSSSSQSSPSDGAPNFWPSASSFVPQRYGQQPRHSGHPRLDSSAPPRPHYPYYPYPSHTGAARPTPPGPFPSPASRTPYDRPYTNASSSYGPSALNTSSTQPVDPGQPLSSQPLSSQGHLSGATAGPSPGSSTSILTSSSGSDPQQQHGGARTTLAGTPANRRLAQGAHPDFPRRHIIHRASKEVPKWYMIDAQTGRTPYQALLDSLEHYESEGRLVAEKVWGTDDRVDYCTFLAIGSAANDPRTWRTPAKVPLAPENGPNTFLDSLADMTHLVIFGPDGITSSTELLETVVCRLRDGCALVFTVDAGRAYLSMTKEALLFGLRNPQSVMVDPQVRQLLPLIHIGGDARASFSAAKRRQGTNQQRAPGAAQHQAPLQSAPRQQLESGVRPKSFSSYIICAWNDCDWVGRKDTLEWHRSPTQIDRDRWHMCCAAFCPLGCPMPDADVGERRRHIELEHPEYLLCPVPTCTRVYHDGSNYHAATLMATHQNQHAEGTCTPSGAPLSNSYVATHLHLIPDALPPA